MLPADARTAHGFSGSYLLGNDTQHGWGTRYFFTFYSEFGARHGVATAEAVVLLAVFAASVVANVSVAAAVLRYREMRTVTNCFLLNLSVADVLFAVGIPAIAVARVRPHWQLGNIVCKLLPYSQVGLSECLIHRRGGGCIKFKLMSEQLRFIRRVVGRWR